MSAHGSRPAHRRSDSKKFLMLMLFGIGLGILGYVLFTRYLHIRLF